MSYETIALLMFASMVLLLSPASGSSRRSASSRSARCSLLYGTGGVEMPFNATFKLFNWFPMLTLPLFIYMGYILAESGIAEDLYRMLHVWFGRVAGGLAIGTIAPDGHHLGDERPLGRRHGDRRDHRAARDAAPRLRQGADLGRGAGRLVARHPDPAVGRDGALRHDRPPAGQPALARRHRARPAHGGLVHRST